MRGGKQVGASWCPLEPRRLLLATPTCTMLALLGAVSGAPSAYEFAAASKEARAPAPAVDPYTVAFTAASRGPPGSHNTVASYMESKAALELGAELCEKCTPSENTINNCCSVGASWEGTCGDGLTHTWLAGYSACNGDRAQVSAISGAKVIHEKMLANHLTDDDLDPESRRIIQERRVTFEHEQKQKKYRKRLARRQATLAVTRAREAAVALEAELQADPTKPGAGWLRRDLVSLQRKVAGLTAVVPKGVVSPMAIDTAPLLQP